MELKIVIILTGFFKNVFAQQPFAQFIPNIYKKRWKTQTFRMLCI